MDRFYDVKNRLVDMAAQSSDIRAVIVIGSQTRSIEKADEYSDLDIILITDRPEDLLYSDEKLSDTGRRIRRRCTLVFNRTQRPGKVIPGRSL